MIHPIESQACHDGEQRLFWFENGYGASVVRTSMTYGNRNGDGYWELAVLHGPPDSNHLCYATPITGDVIGWLDEPATQAILEQIAALPYLNHNACPRRMDPRDGPQEVK